MHPRYSLCYTSNRAQAVEPVLQQWVNGAELPKNVEVICSYDEGNVEVQSAFLAARGALPCEVKIVPNTGPRNCVAGWNAAAAHATGDILITISDDFSPPRRWDSALTQCASLRWWEGEWVVWVNDGYNLDVLTISILTKKRYQRFGYVFYSGYSSIWCDTEYGTVARKDNVVIDARHLLFEHLHPDCGKRGRDASDALHNSPQRWQFGETLFKVRANMGFPLDQGPVAEANAIKPITYAVIIQAIKDDLCLKEVVQRIMDEGKWLEANTPLKDKIGPVYIFSPDTRWDGRPALPSDLAEVAEIARQVGAINVPFRVKDVANTQQSRIMIETQCRNWYNQYCLEHGYEHCLVVDGDELWKKGLLGELNDLVRERWPMSAFTGLIPVVGRPGLPVEGAKDKAGIYCRADSRFEFCRGSYGFKQEIPGYPIYHFTAVRKTWDELVDKHMSSGHSDDPTYEFAKWVKEVLPGIKVGTRNAHMWLMSKNPEANVWPLVRAWSETEWQELPENLKQYLAPP